MKDNMRKCIGCQTNHDRNSMIRIMQKFDTKELILFPTNKDFGRSIYICKNTECIKKALKKGKNNQILKSANLEKIKETLQKYIIN